MGIDRGDGALFRNHGPSRFSDRTASGLPAQPCGAIRGTTSPDLHGFAYLPSSDR